MKLQKSLFFISFFSLTACTYTAKEENHDIVNKTNDTSDSQIVIVKTLDKGDYFYIPQSAFSDSVDAVLYQEKTMLKVNPDNRPINLSWNSTCNDGSYILTINPDQIFFSDGHDNPNPNSLYWVMNISRKQFDLIAKGIRKKTPKGFKNLTATRTDSLFHDESKYDFFQDNFSDTCLIPEVWDELTESKFSTCCDATLSQQLVFYSKILNSYISNDSEKVQFPNNNEWIGKSPKYFSYYEQAIYDWAPKKRKQN